MREKNILLKTVPLVTSMLIVIVMFLPIISNASSLTDSAPKAILKTIEDIEKNINEEKYPGYKEMLITLKKANSNWKFTLYYTGLDWNTVIYNETKGMHSRSLVQEKNGEWICNDCGTKAYDAGRLDVCI